MKPTVYLETSIISYLTARPSSDIFVSAMQQTTAQWWDVHDEYDSYVSDAVWKEAARGDPEAARRRLAFIARLPMLEPAGEALVIVQNLISQFALPAKAVADATHIAIAAVNGMDYLLTWNCTHIANATLRTIIERVCREAGYEPPVICTPPELLGLEDADI